MCERSQFALDAQSSQFLFVAVKCVFAASAEAGEQKTHKNVKLRLRSVWSWQQVKEIECNDNKCVKAVG